MRFLLRLLPSLNNFFYQIHCRPPAFRRSSYQAWRFSKLFFVTLSMTFSPVNFVPKHLPNICHFKTSQKTEIAIRNKPLTSNFIIILGLRAKNMRGKTRENKVSLLLFRAKNSQKGKNFLTWRVVSTVKPTEAYASRTLRSPCFRLQDYLPLQSSYSRISRPISRTRQKRRGFAKICCKCMKRKI